MSLDVVPLSPQHLPSPHAAFPARRPLSRHPSSRPLAAAPAASPASASAALASSATPSPPISMAGYSGGASAGPPGAIAGPAIGGSVVSSLATSDFIPEIPHETAPPTTSGAGAAGSNVGDGPPVSASLPVRQHTNPPVPPPPRVDELPPFATGQLGDAANLAALRAARTREKEALRSAHRARRARWSGLIRTKSAFCRLWIHS